MSDYQQLKTALDGWLTRNDLSVDTTHLPIITQIAESYIAMKVRCVVQEVTTTLTFTGRSQDLPANFLEQRNPFIDNTTRRFEYKTPQALRESAEWATGRIGQSYTLEGSEDVVAADDRVKMVIAAPASVASPLSVNVNYWRRFDAFTADADTNWLLNNHFEVYLYAMIAAAADYLEEYDTADRYAGKFNACVNDLNRHENRKRFGAVPKQSYGNPRTVV